MILLCGTIVIRCAVDHGPVPDEVRLARQNVRGSSSGCVVLDQRSGGSIVDEYAHVHVGIYVIERMRSIITRWSNGDTCAVAPSGDITFPRLLLLAQPQCQGARMKNFNVIQAFTRQPCSAKDRAGLDLVTKNSLEYFRLDDAALGLVAMLGENVGKCEVSKHVSQLDDARFCVTQRTNAASAESG